MQIDPLEYTRAVTQHMSFLARQVTSSCEIASKRIRRLLEAYFKINK